VARSVFAVPLFAAEDVVRRRFRPVFFPPEVAEPARLAAVSSPPFPPSLDEVTVAVGEAVVADERRRRRRRRAPPRVVAAPDVSPSPTTGF
jgi:hypothetical protein